MLPCKKEECLRSVLLHLLNALETADNPEIISRQSARKKDAFKPTSQGFLGEAFFLVQPGDLQNDVSLQAE